MKRPKQAYMTAFKELAAKRVKRIKDGQRTSIVTRLGLGAQTLRNRVKTSALKATLNARLQIADAVPGGSAQ